ncbi:MAG: GNAT family N-acetyltransferase [Kiritimatiellia bacterium]|nr:GNAT family N-acetyltransferase [Kiritimatiellia bacterium]
MVKIKTLEENKTGEWIDFSERIFNLRKLGYNPGFIQESMNQRDRNDILVIEEEGKIVSCLLLTPYELYFNGVVFKGAEIGGVATDERFRGKGYMSHLMEEAVTKMHREGYDLSCLGGYRDRYATWGYESGGTGYSFCVNKRSTKTLIADKKVNLLQYAPSSSVLAKIIEAHQKLPIRMMRAKKRYELFFNFLKLDNTEAWTGETENDEFAYAVVQRPTEKVSINILEYGGSPQVFECMLKEFFVQWGPETISVAAPGIRTPFAPLLNRIACSWSISPCRQWRVVNLKTCLEKIVAIQAAKINNLSFSTPFSLTLKIKETGENSTIVFDKGCRVTDKQGKEEVVLTQCEMALLFFGVGKPGNTFGLKKENAAYLDLIFPLPLYQWSLDRG